MTINNLDTILRRPRSAGFTLVEMALVVSIMAVLMTLGISTAMSVMQASQRTATQERQAYVREALMAYFMTNHRFPCPDNGSNVGNTGRDGVEDRAVGGANPLVTSGCTVNFGTVPYATLGIARAQAVDAYGNFMSYRLDDLNGWHLTATFPPPPGACPALPVPPTALNVYSAPATLETSALAGRAAVVVLISHGSNGTGAWNQGPTNASRNALPAVATELGNAQAAPAAPAGYRNYVYSDVAATPFDDLVQYITRANLDTVWQKIGRANLCAP